MPWHVQTPDSQLFNANIKKLLILQPGTKSGFGLYEQFLPS